MVTYIRSDLEFILKQIKIAEDHTLYEQSGGVLGKPLFGPNGSIPTYNIAWGLRTVDGTYNHLLPGQENQGSSDIQFPEGLGTDFRPADGTPLDMDGPGGQDPIPTATSYAPSNDPNSIVVDSSLRTISNLIVDQTLTNPAAIMEALERNGIPGDHLAIALNIKAVYDPLVPLFKAVDDAEDAAAEAAAALAANPADPDLIAADAAAQADLAAAQSDLAAARGPLDALLEANGIELDGANVKLTNIAPDEGLSASFNSWFTLFGQFFDHGLDLVGKGGSGTVFVPLQPDDPLFDPQSPTNFMVLTRATVEAGPDNTMGTEDDVRPVNHTTSFVDQNQTYTSHASHQVFLREYMFNAAGDPVSTGRLITNHVINPDGTLGAELGGMATWATVKAQAAQMLGIQLVDANVGNIPLLATDEYGNFIPGANGFPQMVVAGANPGDPPDLVEGDPAANGGNGVLVPPNAIFTGHAFLADIAHNAVPDGLADGDIEVGLANNDGTPATDAEYDNELLDAHFMAGDGRANENIGLTAVHHVFHSEHNRLVQHTKDVVLATGDLAFINEWLIDDIATLPASQAEIDALVWDGQRVFQAAKFGTEMQYQHLVFEEFARKVQPAINTFLVPDGFDTTMDPSIVAEFAHVVYRFGHSMLTETIDRFDPTFTPDHISLIEGFLNPLQFENNGTDAHVDAEIAAGAIIRGMTRQLGNEIDEHVTSALRNNLLGLPLDLPTINLARGRDTGVPSLNAVRQQFYAASNENVLLKPYESWVDFAGHLKNEASIINFIAAYGTHDLITSQTTIEGKRDAALTIITGQSFGGFAVPVDAEDFLNGLGAYAGDLGGLNTVDLWIGGLAEEIMPFGGMLGSTFAYVFEIQLESLQSGDRFYYLQRLDGLHLFGEMENNSFAAMIMRNTNATHLPSDVFSTPGLILEVNKAQQFNPDTGVFLPGPDGVLGDDPLTVDVDESLDDVVDTNADPAGGGLLTPLVIRNDPSTPNPTVDTHYLRYTGDDHVVLGGTPDADTIIASIGDDTLYGDAGNDKLEGGFGNDILNGGDGDDIIKDAGGDDNVKAGAGNDVVHAGGGLDLVMGGPGKDFVFLGTDEGSEVFAGEGDDFIYGNKNAERILGNEGSDWIETGTFDGAPGDNFDEIFAHDEIDGHDVFLGDGGFDEFIGEGGDDIMVGSAGRGKMVGMSGFDWATYKDSALGTAGVNADLSIPIVFDEAPIIPGNAALDEYESIEGLSGSAGDDILKGSNVLGAERLPFDPVTNPVPLEGYQGSVLDAEGIARIDGLQELLGAGVTSFGAGDIILGGAGNDVMQGQMGDDILDGDKWLNVRISVRENVDGTGAEIDSADSMTELASEMFNGTYNPGQLVIQREIIDEPGEGFTDIAVFADVRANYTIVNNPNGSVTVSHVVVSDGLESDGVDTLYNMERVRFADMEIALNNPPTGAPVLSSLTPTEGVPLSVDVDSIDDADGLGALAIQWQSSPDGGTTWNNIPGANTANFIPQNLAGTTPGAQAGQLLRVQVTYTDGNGTPETVNSDPSGPVGLDWDGGGGGDTFNGNAGNDDANGEGGTDTLNGNAGNDDLDGGGGNDTITGGAGNDTVAGGAGGGDVAVFAGPAINFSVEGGTVGPIQVIDGTGAEGTDTVSGVETLRFNGVNYAIVTGGNTNNTNLNGAAGAAGSQAVFGFGGTDSMNGGAGDDILHGGDGTDTINQTSTGGRDIINGGAGSDTYVLSGVGGAETFRIYTRAAAITAGFAIPNVNTEIVVTRQVGVGAEGIIAELDNIEEIVVNGTTSTDNDNNNPNAPDGGTFGGDTVQVIGNFNGTSLNFSTITIDGNAGNDTIDITGLASEHRIVFRSNGGNDTLIGSLRPQDVIELPPGSNPADYTSVTTEGVTTLTNGTNSISYTADGDGPEIAVDDGVNEEETPPAVDGMSGVGTPNADNLTGGLGDDHLIGFAGDDVMIGLGGADILLGGGGDDFLHAGAGSDTAFGDAGDDTFLGGDDADMIYGGDGNDRVFADAGDDLVDAGMGNDVVVGGAGNDRFTASAGDGNDTYFGDEMSGGDGVDTIDYSAISSATLVDLGSGIGGFGSVSGSQTGSDILHGVENVTTGSGADTIVASDAVNVMDGGAGNDTFRFKSIAAANNDTIVGFEAGDKIDLSAIDADAATFGNQTFSLTNSAITTIGQLAVTNETRADGDYTVVSGNVGGDAGPEFRISIKGIHDLTASDFAL